MDTKETREANRLIDALGGTNKAATLCETSESAVSQWRTNGIPAPRLMFIKAVRPELFGAPAKRKPRQPASP